VIADIRRLLIRFEPHIVAGLAVVYFVLYSVLSVLRHETYHSFGPDLGIFDQVFWNTTQGRFLESTMSLAQAEPHSYLADHFSPIYLALLPAYALIPRPATLLVIQTLFLALGVWPIYLLARLKLEPGALRLLWALVYFLFLPVAFINLFDFHELALAVLPLGFAIYFLERGRPGLFLLSLVSTFLIKEELPLVGIAFGAYILLAKRDLKLGIGVLAGSLLAFVGLVRVVIPAFGGGSQEYFARRIASRYAELGTTPQEIIATAVGHPGRLAQILFQGQKLKFLVGIFGPVLGLTAISGFAAVLVLPTLAILLLSNYAPQYAFTSHYSAPLIALVIGTSILGFARLARVPAACRRRGARQLVSVFLLLRGSSLLAPFRSTHVRGGIALCRIRRQPRPDPAGCQRRLREQSDPPSFASALHLQPRVRGRAQRRVPGLGRCRARWECGRPPAADRVL
jgi:uncharacterized membrane protein